MTQKRNTHHTPEIKHFDGDFRKFPKVNPLCFYEEDLHAWVMGLEASIEDYGASVVDSLFTVDDTARDGSYDGISPAERPYFDDCGFVGPDDRDCSSGLPVFHNVKYLPTDPRTWDHSEIEDRHGVHNEPEPLAERTGIYYVPHWV